jgi:hypothetical protein
MKPYRFCASIIVAAASFFLGRIEAQDEPAKPSPRTMRIAVLDPDGKGLPGVNIFASASDTKSVNHHDYTTNAEGNATVELPQKVDLLRLWATKDGYVGLFAQWWRDRQPDGHLIPEEYTFHLAKGTTIGGIVKNGAGELIRRAKVQAQLIHAPGLEHSNRPWPNNWHAYGDAARITDAEGRWSLDNVPTGNDVQVSVMLNHPDYIGEAGWGSLQKAQGVTMEALRDKSATIVMHWGSPITGTVKDADGSPVAGAIVIWGDDPYFQEGSQEVRTDAEGHYRLPPREIGPLTITVVAPNWSPVQTRHDVSPANSVADFQLERGKTLKIAVVDAAGAPIPNVGVGITSWRGGKALYNHKHPNVLDTKIPTKADENGIFEWKWAPEDAVQYAFGAAGFAYVHQHAVTASDVMAVVILNKE